jgi:hypothetical protein
LSGGLDVLQDTDIVLKTQHAGISAFVASLMPLNIDTAKDHLLIAKIVGSATPGAPISFDRAR